VAKIRICCAKTKALNWHSANALKEDKEQYLNVGMNDYIAKPFDANDLGTKITNIITK
jgi:CheY-like chemotaxis protein